MTKEGLAAAITGAEYPFHLEKDLARQAREAGLVVVYGASDDLMEFEGAIREEVGAFEGTTVWLSEDGLFDIDACADKCPHFESAFQHVREYGQALHAVWGKNGYSWQYQARIPHSTFEIMEEGEKYCRGIVFRLTDVEVENQCKEEA